MMSPPSRAGFIPALIAFLALPFLLLPQEKQTLAVLEFDSFGISAPEVAALTNRLRTNMTQLDVYRIIERGQMQQIMLEQDFQLTGCTSDECAVEVGQLLGAQLMLAGSIGKVGQTWSIDMRIIDVETGSLIRSASHDTRGEVDIVLTAGMAAAARKIAGMEELSEIVGTASGLFGGTADLMVNSSPPGGTIYLNDEPAGDATPYRLQGLKEGQYRVVVRKGNLVGETMVTLARLEMEEITIDLKSEEFVLRILTDPYDAQVTINGRRVGSTPMDYSVTDTTIDYLIQLSKDLHKLIIDTLRFSQSTLLRANYDLIASGRMILPDRGDEKIFIDGEGIGAYAHASKRRGRWKVDQLDLGTYELRIEKEHYLPFETQANLTVHDRVIDLRPEFIRREGTLKLSSDGIAAKGSIRGDHGWQDFQIDSDGQASLSVAYGNYSIVARAKDHFRYQSYFKIYSPGPHEIPLVFRKPHRRLATLGSLLYPGLGQIYSLQRVKGFFLFSLMSTSLISIYQTNLLYGEELVRHGEYSEAYLNATSTEELNQNRTLMNNSRENLGAYRQRFLVGLGATVVTYLLNMADISFLYPYKDDPATVSLVELKVVHTDGLSLKVTKTF